METYMGLYFCPNCQNLKIRTVKRRDLKGLSKYKIIRAIKENNVDSLGLSFPLTMFSLLLIGCITTGNRLSLSRTQQETIKSIINEIGDVGSYSTKRFDL